mmetsp:Transcript_864/g.1841  ORF Transcript_864/g.1841 Transcript_864/m.1841 type:complete len:206 (+) Transcript_864:2859-3476(+)
MICVDASAVGADGITPFAAETTAGAPNEVLELLPMTLVAACIVDRMISLCKSDGNATINSGSMGSTTAIPSSVIARACATSLFAFINDSRTSADNMASTEGSIPSSIAANRRRSCACSGDSAAFGAGAALSACAAFVSTALPAVPVATVADDGTASSPNKYSRLLEMDSPTLMQIALDQKRERACRPSKLHAAWSRTVKCFGALV